MRPSREHSIDRIDNERGYESGNIRWATSKEQITNRRKIGTLSMFSDDELREELCRREGARKSLGSDLSAAAIPRKAATPTMNLR